MQFKDFLQNNIVVFDGAFGTMLQKKADKIGTLPELFNIEHPEIVKEIHKDYALAGADVISADTFGANAAKAGSYELSEKLIRAGVRLAREAAPDKYIALDLGPTGKLLEPVGNMTFEEAYQIFAHAIEAGKEGADLVLIETMTDLGELKAALLAAREHCDLPVIASMTFEENMRTFMGCDVLSYALTASPLADAIGVNCSLGPTQLLSVAEKLVAYSDKPIIVQANAGLPDSKMHYSVDAEEFADICEKFLAMGVRIVGGCCGTTPQYIARLRAIADKRKPVPTPFRRISAVCSARKAVMIDGVKVVGERINPTGKKAMKAALLAGDLDYITNQALEQAEAGAAILDVNAGLPEIDEKAALTALVKHLQTVTDLPLQIDCGKPDAIEAALRCYCGKAIINSVNGENKVLDAVLPIAAKYGAAVVGLTIDDKGLPKTKEARIEIAEKIIARAAAYGIPEEDIYIDCLTLTVSAEQNQAFETLAAITEIKRRHRVKTILGVSNISFGLPNRQILNTAFLNMAMYAGLDLPILNPNASENMQAVAAYNALCGYDKNCAEYTQKYANTVINTVQTASSAQESASAPEQECKDLFACIRQGLPRARDIAAELLKNMDPLCLIDDCLIPALNEVGDLFEKGKLFLPQLIAAADSAKGCFDEVKKRLPEGKDTEKGKIVLATVKGDIHDIGKNIVKTVLENYGYTIVDLGKNVPCEKVAETCAQQNIKLCGLSALMTTTVPHMEETIRQIRALCPSCKVMVGGAVLNPDYAKKIGADYYCKDANANVKIAKEIFGK